MGVQVSPWAQMGTWRSWFSASRLHREGRGFESLSAHICRGSSEVEHFSEKEGVVGAIPTRGTKSGCSIVVIMQPCQG